MNLSRFKHHLGVLVCAALIGCAEPPEPGNPPQPPSGLFPGYQSYQTLQDLKSRLPHRSVWQVRSDSKTAPRPGCPRFDELTFAVTAKHLEHSGLLQLTFINDRLEQTLFEPDDFGSYLEALSHNGLHFAPSGEATIAPATEAWLSDPTLQQPRFVGWRDERISKQAQDWVRRCS